MKIKVTYWTAGDALVSATVEAESVEEAINKLADDPQKPLAQVKSVEVVG